MKLWPEMRFKTENVHQQRKRTNMRRTFKCHLHSHDLRGIQSVDLCFGYIHLFSFLVYRFASNSHHRHTLYLFLSLCFFRFLLYLSLCFFQSLSLSLSLFRSISHSVSLLLFYFTICETVIRDTLAVQLNRIKLSS